MGLNTNELKAARVRRGVSQKEMAELLRLPVPSYCIRENGKRQLRLKEINEITEILNLSTQEIMAIFFNRDINSNSNTA